MKYLLKEIQIFEGSNQRGPYSWLQARLFNDVDVFGNPAQLPRYYNMTEQVVALYKPYAVQDTVRSTQELKVYTVNETNMFNDIKEGKIPDYLHIDQIFAVVVPTPGWYARIYKTPVIQNNQQIAAAGEFVKNANGEVTPVNSLVLYLKKYLDPNEMDQTKAWKWVEEPERAMRTVLSRNYKKYDAPVGIEAGAAPAAPTAGPSTSPEDEIAKAKAVLEAAGVTA